MVHWHGQGAAGILGFFLALGLSTSTASAQQSRVSILGEGSAKRILVDGQPLTEDKMSMTVSVEREWTSGPAAGLVLLGHYSGGTMCPATHSIVDLNGPVPRISDQFGTCSDLPDEYVGTDILVITFPGETRAWTYSKTGLAEAPRLTDAEHITAGVAAYQARDYSRALAHLWPVRHGRDAQAFYTLGLMAHLGKGVPRDYGKARKFYLEAAERDLPAAYFRVGVLHANGRDVPKDMAEANRWYRKAAEHGDGLGQYNLALNILTGAGAKKDDAEALLWMLLARERLLNSEDRAAAEKNISILEARLGPDDSHRIRASAVVWKPASVDPFPDAASLRAWSGKYPWTRLKGTTLFEVPGVRSRLTAALGAERIAALEPLIVSDEVSENAGWLLASGCMPHVCDVNHVVYGINLTTYDVVVCLAQADTNLLTTKMVFGSSDGRRVGPGPSGHSGCPKKADLVLAVRAALTVPSVPTPAVAAVPSAPSALPTPGTMIPPAPSADVRDQKRSSSGSGFVISNDGHILTNQHVVAECRSLSVRRGQTSMPARLVAADAKNDLAVMRADLQGLTPLPFRDGRGIRPGDSVVAVGFPYAGLLSTTSQVTTGTVTSLAGIADDTRYLQISAPIQPGNSGGPLLDAGGTVAGVIVATLNALTVVKATGSVPQNVNFAIKSSVARAFLDAKGIDYSTAAPEARMEPADIGERGTKSAVMVECFE